MFDDQRNLVPLRVNPMRPAHDVGDTCEIIVNGRKHLIEGSSIEHCDLVRLAFPQIRASIDSAVTIAFRGGPSHAPEGLLTVRQRTPIAHGETFVVTQTVAS